MEYNLSVLLGSLMSILFEWVPGFSGWYGQFEEAQKRWFMVGVLAVIVGVLFGLSCYGQVEAYACTEQGLWGALSQLFVAIASNQGTYSLTKKS